MAVVKTTPERSALMARVRQKGTANELVVRQALHALGGRFRVNRRALPGSPDISSERRRKAIFVNGCFWHAHRGCLKATLPKNNGDFWRDKLAANVARDARKTAELRRLRFDVLIVWECELPHLARLRTRLNAFWFGAAGKKR
ncbi:MAG TPA: very short patch repair endonuclease [Thermoanaerobaculia bacterium]|nr:very short patch repair endonuclease [Thermoanaerobaculia bacterium]